MKNISDIILGTGSYNNVKTGNTVSITGDGGNNWGYYGPSYKKLAPKLETYNTYISRLSELEKLKNDVLKLKEYIELKKEIENQYIISYYQTRLKDLNIDELIYILNQKFGNNIIFLCHEPIDQFCHRRIFADNIEIVTGVYIPEIKVDCFGNIKKLNPIRYKNRLKKLI